MGDSNSQNDQQDRTTAQQVAITAGSALNTAAQFATAKSGNQFIAATGGALLTAATIPSPAAPFLAIAGGIAELLGALGIGGGCGQTCIQATQYANQASDLLVQNAQTYFSIPAPRPKSAQQAALANAQQIWSGLVQACSNPALNDAGKRCISDRQEGSCTWRVPASQGGPEFPGGPGPGECFNWWNALIDPIANDPNVYDDGGIPSLGIGSGGRLLPILGVALIALAAIE